ncbi:hypothetical protein U4960_00105 [Altererythrobacter sp. H2]|uniref:hypothetical protein n=1 Tax=Altererythrobacter sp. H2 TaxID=3108391 RepID=UPI002B4BAC82|nr:hypothetical protein [Altererythrobacter sp. H2]WRK95777.1 hypothetical protein U4960_00105 [Altererythrobacter sp. H2]
MGDPRIRESGFTCLRIALENASEAEEETKAGEVALWEAQRTGLQPDETVDAQCEALRILALAAPQSAEEIVERRLTSPLPGDDFFVRREIVRLVASSAAFDRTCEDRLRQATSDPSAAVRQCVAGELWRRPGAAKTNSEELAGDNEPKVRAMLVVRLPLLAQSIGTDRAARILQSRLAQEAEPFVLRAALRVAVEWSWSDVGIAQMLAAELREDLTVIHSGGTDPKLRRWAAETIEQIWCAADPEARALAARVRAATAPVAEGRVVVVPGLAEAAAQDEILVGRVLSVLAQEGYSLELLSGGRLRHGELIGFRSWRLLHEWRHPGSDKRQGFSHWTGRIWRGRTVAPSNIMAELAPTKVPGEPLFQPSEGNWRPWLPLPDLILSTIDTGKLVKVHSAEGITEIHPPKTFLERLLARIKLTWNFARFASLRNWDEGSGSTPDAYSNGLRKIGVNLVLKQNPDREVDPQVVQFFSFGPVFLAVPLFWDQAATYFSSLYANTLLQLALFIALASAWFFFRHVFKARRMRRARESLAIVVGGWGTRGKSGTERLSSAQEAEVAQLLRTSGLAEATGIADHFEAARQQLQEYRILEASLQSSAAPDEIDLQLREQAHRWFQAKIVVVQDYYATGEEIVRTLAGITPPGFRNRVMGMQNIKGTGLDFVYRWHAWETVHRACADALGDDQAKVQRGLETLSSFREFGILSAELVRHVVKELRAREITGGEISQTLLDLIEAQLLEQLAQQKKSGEGQEKSGSWSALVAWIEAFLDSGDAVRRRKKADLIYKELSAERISSSRAVVELKKLTTRQKGGWLQNDLKSSQMRGLWSAITRNRLDQGRKSASH